MPVVVGTQYATTTDLTNLGLIGGALATVSAATQNAALQAASAIADSYLQSRYDLPLVAWGQDLARVVCAIAAYDLLTSRGFAMTAGSDENIRKRYMDALAWLQEVSQGLQTPAQVLDSSVGGTTGATTAPTSSDGSVVTTTQGGLQLVTSGVRGWTSRGGSSGSGGGFWDKGS